MGKVSIILILGLLISNISCGRKKGVRLLDYHKVKLCDSVEVDFAKVKTTLTRKILSESTLALSVRTIAECTIDFYGLLKYDNDTLKLFYFPKGLFPKTVPRNYYIIQDGYELETKDQVPGTFCECYFEMNYKISGIKEIPKFIKINGENVFDDKSINPR